MSKKILLFGENGQVAWELRRSLPLIGDVICVGSSECPFEKPDTVIRTISEVNPDFIVNAAAYTSSERAEEEQEKANIVNGHTVGLIAEKAKELSIPMVHYSTDYVFDGKKTSPWVETDEPNPLSAYGRSKVLGEKYIQQVDGNHIILRVSWVYGHRGINFYRTMLRLGKERDEVRVVDDQVGAPTWSRNIAEATTLILSQEDVAEKKGLYHLSSRGVVSWNGFAKALFEETKRIKGDNLMIKKVIPITTEEYPTKVKRPLYSVMDNSRLKAVFGIEMPLWNDALRRVCEDDTTV